MGRRPYTPEEKEAKLQQRRERKEKRCSACQEDKPIGEFYGKGDNNYCKECNRLAVLTGDYKRLIRDDLPAAQALLVSLMERARIMAELLVNQTGEQIMATDKLNNTDRSQWLDNDEGLYSWWKDSKLSKAKFIQENKAEIDKAINNVLGNKKPAHYLAYEGNR